MSIYYTTGNINNSSVQAGDPSSVLEIPPAVEMAVRALLNYGTADNYSVQAWVPDQWVVTNTGTAATALYNQTDQPFPFGQPSTTEVVTGTNPNASAGSTEVAQQRTDNWEDAQASILSVGNNYGLSIQVSTTGSFANGNFSMTVKVIENSTENYVQFTAANPPIL